ncbi:MAG: ABC transporter permease [Candidatus Omnitrophota bacterium]|nr:ABC transporter permease [Candidatus Omnitrophota bacterium]
MNLIVRFKKIIAERQIIRGMVIKNLKSKYIGSISGILWAVINPLLIMLVITFVFSQIMKTDIKHFPLLVLSALLPWNFFNNSINESAASISSNVDVLRQFVMLKETIPIATVITNLITFLFGFIIVLPVFIMFNTGIVNYLILLPFVVVLHFIFTLGISMLLSIINVYFKDLPQLLNIFLMLLFWLTPVFYSIDMIPQKYHWLIIANPSACYIIIYRALLYQGFSGGISIWLLAIGFALISIISGYFLFMKKESEILKYA